jgi:23S rRNA pseudouridine2604 synthase
LILLTNNGDIVNKVLRKENRHEKEYIVTVDRPITQKFLKMMSGRIPMLGTRTLPSKVTKLKPNVFKIILTQGLNRQIRRMCEFCGYNVLALKRVRIMHLRLGNLTSGKWRPLTNQELEVLLKDIGYES